MRRNIFVCAAIIAAVIPSVQLFAAGKDDLPVVKTSVKTLAAFKNGLGFAFRSGTSYLKNGWMMMKDVPDASLGALWYGTATPNCKVENIISYEVKSDIDVDLTDYLGLLKANAGRKVTVYYYLGGKNAISTLTGTVISIPDDKKVQPANSSYYAQYPSSQILLIKKDNGQIAAINKSSIQSVELPKGASIKAKRTSSHNSAKIKINGNPKSAEIDMAYLEKNITWSPSYLIDIKDNKQASITLQATLLNDAEDLEHTDVSFVVGYPNFAFADVMNPLITRQSVADFLAALSSGYSTGYSRSASSIMSQSLMANSADYQSSSEMRPEYYSVSKPAEGESKEDLYFYKQPNVTLKKGERAQYVLFTNNVPYEHVYEWNVPDSMNIDIYGHTNNRSETNTQVWHTLRLENTGKQPWTTAPAFVVNGSLPIAQDTLKYVPSKGKTTFNLTVATDVLAQQPDQTEVSRTQSKIENRIYDVVTIGGLLKIKSYKPDPIKVSVCKSIIGAVVNVDNNGKITKIADIVSAVNPNSKISWEFILAPGEEKILTYQYSVLIYNTTCINNNGTTVNVHK